jgi:hypothetical protein
MTNPGGLWVDAFLAALAEHGVINRACEAVGIDRQTVWIRRQKNPDFAAQCELAIEMSADKLEQEARRRALEGVEEPVYQGGQLVGTRLVYSDSLLALMLKGRRKKVFADRTEVTGANGGPVKAAIVIATGVPSDVPDTDIA